MRAKRDAVAASKTGMGVVVAIEVPRIQGGAFHRMLLRRFDRQCAMDVFVTGGTGYIGQALIPGLLQRGHQVIALVRPGSLARVPPGTVAITGDALDSATFAGAIPRGATLVHLVGTPHPNPSKAAQFERVDLGSIRASVEAASAAGAAHLVYVSVAQPATMMRAYVAARPPAKLQFGTPASPPRSCVRGTCWAWATGGP
jgi:NAD(P)H-binding